MKTTPLIIFILIVNTIFGQAYIDKQQDRIDMLDGEKDKYLRLINLDARNSATYTYITLIDLIQESMLYNDNLPNENKVIMFKEMHKELSSINPNKLTKSTRDEKKYKFLLAWLKAFEKNEAYGFMQKNKNEVFSIINYVYPFKVTKKFLTGLPSNYVDKILYNYDYVRKTDYGQQLLEKVVEESPLTCKKYFFDNQTVYQDLKTSKDHNINVICFISDKYRRNSKAYVLLDKIVDGSLSIVEANKIGKDKALYFKSLLEIRTKKHPLAEISLDRELNYEALEYVREINYLHEETSDKIRFESVNKLSAKELYTLLIYSEDEVFTSSFNGIYSRLINKMKSEKISGFKLLNEVGFNRFRTFIKMASYYGKLSGFLASMNSIEKNLVLSKFINGIKHSEHRIEDAVSIANAISAIEDKGILKVIEQELYITSNFGNLDGDSKLIYSLLMKIFEPKAQIYKSFFDSLANLYHTPPIDKIVYNKLLGEDGINIQKHFFYDDDDGLASFNSFKLVFRENSNWNIIENDEYITVVSKNKKVKLYVNKPQFDETAWYHIDKKIKENNEDVEFVIHRGHSYYVDETIDRITESTKLILLGSCGGYNRLSQLLDKSDNAQIISTRQIGSMGVNNPLILQMAEKIRKGKDLVWTEYWDSLKVYFEGKGKTEERFKDYVPPHQNLGAKFIAAYNLYSWVN